MTAPTATLSDRLEELGRAATGGPYDTLTGHLVRAIRGDMAIPILEARTPYGEPGPAPTVRDARGHLLFRKGSRAADDSRALKAEHANIELSCLLLNNLPTIISALRSAGL